MSGKYERKSYRTRGYIFRFDTNLYVITNIDERVFLYKPAIFFFGRCFLITLKRTASSTPAADSGVGRDRRFFIGKSCIIFFC